MQDAAPEVAYWWVNHGPEGAREIEGGYLWRAKGRTGRAGGGDALTQPLPGDVIFSHRAGLIGAIGVVLERVRTSPAPGEARARTGGEPGWLLPVRFEKLREPLAPRRHRAALKAVMPHKGAPLRADGTASAAYLSAVPLPLAKLLDELCGGELARVMGEVAIESDGQLAGAGLEERIWQRADLEPAAKRELVSARGGRGVFRANVERVETACRVTGVLDRRHLRAVHIKPWHACDDRERLDGCNGLLLGPHIAQLFSRGHISFADNGELLLSEQLNRFVKKAWGLERARAAQPFRPEQRAYLKFHRAHVFEQLSAGRRR